MLFFFNYDTFLNTVLFKTVANKYKNTNQKLVRSFC